MADIIAVSKSKRRKQPSEGKLLGMWSRKYEELDRTRDQYAKNWSTYIKNYKSKVVYETDDDGKETDIAKIINFPIEREHIEAAISEEYARPPQYTYEPQGEDDRWKVDVLKVVDEHLDYKDNFQYKLVQHGYQKKIMGYSVMFDGFNETQKEVSYYNVKGELESRTEVERDFYTRVVDVRHFWIDNVDDISKAQCCMEDEYIPEETFRSRYLNNPNYIQAKVKEVKGQYSVTKAGEYFYDKSDDTGQKLVKITHCYKVAGADGDDDRYDVIVNNDPSNAGPQSGQLIRKGPNWHPLKWLPYSIQSDTIDFRSILGGVGTCQNLEQHKAAKVSAFDAYSKQAAFSSISELILGEDVEIPGLKEGGKRVPGGMHEATGNISNIKDLISPPPNATLLNVIQELDADASRLTGYDPNSLTQINPSEAATKVMAREEQKRKRVALYDMQGDKFLKRMKELRKANIMAFYPQPLYDALTEDDPAYASKLKKGEFEFPKLALKGTYKKVYLNKNDEITTENKKDAMTIGAKIEKDEEETSILEITPAMIRGNIDIKVRNGSNRPLLRSLELAQLLEVADLITKLATQGEALQMAGFPLEKFVDKVNELTNFKIEREGKNKEPIEEATESIAKNQLQEPIFSPNQDATINTLAELGATPEAGAIGEGEGVNL